MLWLSGPGTGAYGAGAAIAMDGGMSNTACAISHRLLIGGGWGKGLPFL